MATTRTSGPGEMTLRERLASFDPPLTLVSPRILRRVIKRHTGLRNLGLQVPHAGGYGLPKADLRRILSERDLLARYASLPDHVLLVAEPHPRELRELDVEGLLLRYWRRAFHLQIHVAFEDRAEALTGPEVARRIDAIGQIEFDEIRAVLRKENLLLPPRGDLSTYVEFVALYLELRYFQPDKLSQYFPTLEDHDLVDALCAEDVDGDTIFERTRPPGAPTPGAPESLEVAPTAPRSAVSAERASAVAARAAQAARKGNRVRAAVLWNQAALAPGDPVPEAAAQARSELAALAERLPESLRARGPSPAHWVAALEPLLGASDVRRFNLEARVLYDLQKVCSDTEREVFRLDLVGWLRSFGRLPLRRPLPTDRLTRPLKHLRGALARVRKTRLGPLAKRRLGQAIGFAIRAAEQNLRDDLRPRLLEALAHVEMMPDNIPEEVAREKLVDELIDRISARGFIRIGDLRDAISRNQLKMPDLRGPVRFLRGDELLGLDKRLDEKLGGGHRRGEVYMRMLQRLSSLAFGNFVGRLVTRYAILPFGGAFVVLEGLQHLVGAVSKLLGGGHPHLLNLPSFLATGTVLLGLIHVPPFRRGVWEVLKAFGRAIRFLFYRLPKAFFALEWVRRLLRSRPAVLLGRFVFKPALVAAPLSLPMLFAPVERWVVVAIGATLFMVVTAILNTRAGRDIEEISVDAVARGWQSLRYHILPGLIQLLSEFFRGLVELIERGLYTVDEWLRFKGGESPIATGAKLVLGLVWAFATYLVRIYVNLLIEPQVNPIKHFPVVTVSHKIILPFTLQITAVFAAPLVPIFGQVVGQAIAGFTTVMLPGVFGFLVWEFKENWKLYDANRAKELRPIIVGHHSETILRLMKPGFHSGTLPKLYTKLRRSERAVRRGAAEKHRRALHDVEHAASLFVERELCALLARAPAWRDAPVRVSGVDLGSNRIRIGLGCAVLGTEELFLSFEEQSGWLVAGIGHAGWLHVLSEERRVELANALAGLFKLAGVHLVRPQLQAVLGGIRRYDVADEGLIVWPESGYEVEVVYPLRGKGTSRPLVSGAHSMPALPLSELRYDLRLVTWKDWVAAFDSSAAADEARPLFPDFQLLPPSQPVESAA